MLYSVKARRGSAGVFVNYIWKEHTLNDGRLSRDSDIECFCLRDSRVHLRSFVFSGEEGGGLVNGGGAMNRSAQPQAGAMDVRTLSEQLH